MTDEKYFCFDGDNMPGSARYHINEKCPDDARFYKNEKFLKKILMWIAKSNRGMSKPLFGSIKSVAIDSNIFINEFLSLRF